MSDRYELMVPRKGTDEKTYYTRIGVAFPNKAGTGFNLTFEALPVPQPDGRVVVLMMEPLQRDNAPRQAARPAARPQQTYENRREAPRRAAAPSAPELDDFDKDGPPF